MTMTVLTRKEIADARRNGRVHAMSLYLTFLLQEKQEPDEDEDDCFQSALIEEERGQGDGVLDVAFGHLGYDLESGLQPSEVRILLDDELAWQRVLAWEDEFNTAARSESRRIYKMRQKQVASVRRSVVAGAKSIARALRGLDKRDPVREELEQAIGQFVAIIDGSKVR